MASWRLRDIQVSVTMPVWAAVVIGVVLGFALGLAMNARLLKGISRERLLNDPDLRAKYGVLNWSIAGIGGFLGYALVTFL